MPFMWILRHIGANLNVVSNICPGLPVVWTPREALKRSTRFSPIVNENAVFGEISARSE